MLLLPPQVHTALSMLTDAGFSAYLVGGCVRDALLGQTPQDFDIATSARPEQVEAVFSGQRVVETGLKHGTVTLLLGGMPLEITTFRIERGYSDGRHPDRVEFTDDLTADLSRRDFTVNAMAYHPQAGLVDPFCGRTDLEGRVLRCVGEPAARFTEDALRILRLLRFASRLGFSVAPETAAAAVLLRENLHRVSAERIQKELTGLLCGEGAGTVLLQYPEIFGVFLPELWECKGFLQHNPHHKYDVLTHLCRTVDAVPARPVLRLAALLHDIGKPACFTLDEQGVGHFYGHATKSAAMAEEILTRLRYDNETKRQVVRLVKCHDLPLAPPLEPTLERSVRRGLNRLGAPLFFDLLALKRADDLAHGVPHPGRQAACDRAEETAKALLAADACFSLRDLAVNGSDLLAHGVPAGREVGEILNRMLGAVLDGTAPNEKQALLRFAGIGNADAGTARSAAQDGRPTKKRDPE